MIGLKGIKIFPKAAVTTSNVGTAVSASFNSANGAVTISSTSGIGTINKSTLRSFFSRCGISNIKTITFANQVYAPQDSYQLFMGLTNLTSINANYLNTSKTITLNSLFRDCTNLITVGDISNWNIGNVTEICELFRDCANLTTIGNLSKWNTSKVQNMTWMFCGCKKLTSIVGIGNWNTTSATNLQGMFSGCTNLTTVGDLSKWNVSNVTSMYMMFYYCNNLTTVGNLSSWNTSKVTNMEYMFRSCQKLTKLDLRNWNMAKVTNVNEMLWNCSSLEEIYTPAVLPSGKTITLSRSYRDWDKMPQEKNTTYSSISSANSKFSKSVHLFIGICVTFDLDIAQNYKLASYDSVLKTRIYLESEIKKQASTGGTEGYGTDLLPITKDGKSILWDENRWKNETGVTYTFLGWKSSYNNSTYRVPYVSSSFNKDIVYTATFRSNIIGPNAVADFNETTGEITISSTSGIGTIDRSLWKAFYESYGAGNIKTITFTNEVYAPQNSNDLFSGFTNLTSINANYLNVSNVIYMSNMFSGCNSLPTLETISSWNVSNVIDMSNMFNGCNELTTIEYLNNWNVGKVTNMSNMFSECNKLTTIGNLNNWNVSNVTDMSNMFNNCSSLAKVDLSNWNTKSLTTIKNLFNGCEGLVSLNLSSWNMEKVTDITDMFKNCNSLEEIYTPEVLPENLIIKLPSFDFRDANVPEDDNMYGTVAKSDSKFSKTVHLFKGICIIFDLSIAEEYKLEGYDTVLQNRIFLDSEIKNMSNTGGTEGKGEDLLPITKDGKSIFWDNDRLESETGYKFAGWESSYDNNIFQVPFVSSYFHADTIYTAVFSGNETEYNLELTSIGEQTGKLLSKSNYRIEGAGRNKFEEKHYTTDESGTLIIKKLQKDEEYTLTELKTAPGYKVHETPIKFKATAENGIWKLEVISGGFSGRPVFRGSTLKVELEDEIAFKVEKTDSETGENLQGAKFIVKDSTGNYAKDVYGNEVGTIETINGVDLPVITTNRNGFAVAEVNPGIYEVTEVQAPFGYDLPENLVQNIEIKLLQEQNLGVEEIWSTKFSSNSSDIIERVVLTKDGGRIFVGSIGDVQEDEVIVKGGSNLVVKYNKTGRRVWGVNFRYDYPNMVVETKDEGLLVLGSKGMVKYKKSGEGYEEEWDSTILTAIEGLTVFRYITETSDGGFTLAGKMNRNITLKDATTSTTLNLKGSEDIFIIKYKKSGDAYVVEWAENMATSGGPFVTAIMETQDKGILIGGAVTGSITLPDGSSLTNTKTVDNTFLIKYNQNTNGVGYTYNWGKRLTGDQNRITGITETTNGEYVVGGYLNGTVNLPNGTNLIGKGSLDNMVVKFDSSGDINLSFSIGGTGAELVNQVSATNDGGFVTAGSMTSNVTLENGQEIIPKGNRDALVVRYDKNGHVLWANTYGGSAMDYFTSVHVDSDNNILLGTYFASDNLTLYNGDILEGYRNDSGTRTSVDAAIIHLKEFVEQPEFVESQIILFEDSKHLYNITTEVEGEGGTISGEGETSYEQVKYRNDSQKDIIVTPDKGYEINSITVNGVETNFVKNDDGTVILDKFTNVWEDKHVVAKFELKPFDVIRNEINKTGTELVSKEGQEVSYDIQYSGEIEGYNGKATVTIVDYLPYEIDESTSLLDGGTYDENAKTITWVENILEAETESEENKVIEINKHITVNYKNVDYTQPMFTNRVTSNLVIGDKEYTASGTHDTRISFTKTVEVTKKWDNTNNMYEIPNTAKIQLMDGTSVVAEKDLTSMDRVSDIEISENEDIWKYEFTELPIYDEAGREIVYTVNEVQTNELKNYEATYDQENMIITNTYVGPVISQTKETITEYGKAYVVEGEKITYKITAKNDGKVAKDVVIKDNIPLGTTYVENSIKVNGVSTSNNEVELANGIIVSIPANGETILSFDVTVDELAEGIYFKQLKNTAVVDGKDTNETTINVNKSNIVFEKTVTPEGNVAVGQELTYNIKVENTGILTDTVRIEDVIPNNTIYVADSVKLGDVVYTDEELIAGLKESSLLSGMEENIEIQDKSKALTDSDGDSTENDTTVTERKVTLTKLGDIVTKIIAENIQLGENEETTLSFKVRVNDKVENGTKIENIAIVNGKPTVPVENIVVKPIINVEKEIKEIDHADEQKTRLDYVFRGDTITYNIKATNTGDIGGYVNIKDIISDKVNFEVGSLKVNGSSSTDLSSKTADDLTNGIQVYVPERQGEKAGESILSFTVQVKDTAEGDIENKATWIDGEKIEENQTKIVSVPVVVFEKRAEVIRNSTEEGLTENTVTVNDEIKYIIKLQNTGTADSGSFTVTDVIPENTKVDSLNISDDGKIQGDKIIWNIESLKSGEIREVNFIATVKYNDIDKLEIKNTAYVNEKPSNEVVKEYIKPVTKLITDITKDGDDTVLIGNGIKYKIEYSEEIENFIGKANVVIVDQLPYEIDEEKSDIGDGIYDKNNKTITWTVQQDNIDTYTSGNVNNVITKKLLLYYKTDRKEQMIENTVKATTQLIKIPEEVVETQEKTASHLVNVKQMTLLPETGGIGIELFIDIGLALIGMGIIILANRKKFYK